MTRQLTVPRHEFEARVHEVAREATRRGFDGVLIWGRGGGPLERYANVYYLTDHYSAFPTIPDIDGAWAARGYSAVAVSASGRVGLATDSSVGLNEVYATLVEHGHDVVACAAAVVRQLDLAGGRLALLGADILSVAHAAALSEALPGLSLTPTDDFLEALRMVKSEPEQRLMRAAAEVGARAVAATVNATVTGVSEADLAAIGMSTVAASGGAVYNVFAEASGPSHRRIRHRLPTYRATNVLSPGDIFAVDISGAVDGYFFDVSRSSVVGGGDAKLQESLIGLARRAVMTVVNELWPGSIVGAAVRRGLAVLESDGTAVPDKSFPAFGHGIGLGWERPWLLPDDETLIRAGMCIAVEQVVDFGPYSASYENDVLVTTDGPVVMSGAAGE